MTTLARAIERWLLHTKGQLVDGIESLYHHHDHDYDYDHDDVASKHPPEGAKYGASLPPTRQLF